MGQSITAGGDDRGHRRVHARRQHPGRSTDDGRDVVPGSGEVGRVARAGPPAGRLLQGPGQVGGHVRRASTASATRSPATTPRSTPTARVMLLGRGSVVHQHRRREGVPRGGRGGAQAAPVGADAVVVGVPDERFGEAITAVVTPCPPTLTRSSTAPRTSRGRWRSWPVSRSSARRDGYSLRRRSSARRCLRTSFRRRRRHRACGRRDQEPTSVSSPTGPRRRSSGPATSA